MPKNEGLKSYHIGNKRDTISACRSWVKNDLVFTSGAGTKIDSDNLRRALDRALQKAGIRDVLRIHSGIPLRRVWRKEVWIFTK
ncbi:hypothetical protein [Candidatus Kuenenia sp.]|uniref:hypothetical protein n=1 Tax=Candidatus Kuenenia sp. TaxID=2499824 RepID=UPI003AF41D9B